MSDYMSDLGIYYSATSALAAAQEKGVSTEDKSSLDMTDFLSLMVAQFQNQSIDSTADTSDMLNQLVQMQMITAMTNLTEASIMSYASSLVGKEVTIGQYNNGTLEELVGTVTGTGVAGGEQVIFVNGKSYYLSDIMAVGRLPEIEEPETDDDADKDTDGVEGSGSAGGADSESEGTGETGGVEAGTEGTGETGGTETGTEGTGETGGTGTGIEGTGETGGTGTGIEGAVEIGSVEAGAEGSGETGSSEAGTGQEAVSSGTDEPSAVSL